VEGIFDDNGNGWREPVNVPNGLYTWVEYEEKKLSVLETKIEKHVQELHFDTGIHRRKTVFSTEDGQRITVEAERFASLEDIHLLVMRYQVTADKDLDIKIHTCIYALLAAQIGKTEWAYQYLMKAAQIDLTGDYKLYLGDLYIGGTHPAANGGTWMVLTQGFAGLEAEEDGVHFSPHLPEKWRKLKFRFNYGGSRYRVEITKDILKIIGEDAAKELRVTYMGNIYTCSAGSTLKIQMENREGK